MKELIVDLFAGGGGASHGIERAVGRNIDIAINHSPEAICMHEANHPHTKHYIEDVFAVDPIKACQGHPVGLLWASPDCKHFSRAKGGKPLSKKIRSLAWVIVKWAKAVRPRVICGENVPEFTTWCPLGDDGYPIADKKGETFELWRKSLESLGYVFDYRELVASDHGAPTIRKRLYFIARCDGEPIVWPEATHGDPKTALQEGLKPWRTASECIDWTLPCPSIFERSKPLADNTLKRIARGLVKYVLESPEPFIVKFRTGATGQSIHEPLPTITAGSFVKRPGGNGHALGICIPKFEPLKDNGELCAAFLAQHYTGKVGIALNKPIGTVTTVDHHSLVEAKLKPLGKTEQLSLPFGDACETIVSLFLTECANGSSQRNFSATEPLRTQCAEVKGGHFAAVYAFLIKYYGNDKDGQSLLAPMHTVTTRDRMDLVIVHINGEPYYISDICLRMLQPHELFAAQGFDEDYIIDPMFNGKPLTKEAKVRLCGNSVAPPVAEAIIQANYEHDQLIQISA